MTAASETLIPAAEASSPIPIHLVAEGEALSGLGKAAAAYAASAGFTGQAGRLLLLPGASGAVERVLFGLGAPGRADAQAIRGLSAKLEPGDYALVGEPAASAPEAVALAWAQGAYVFDRYKREPGRPRARLAVADGVDLERVRRAAHACALARDMIDTPASDMGPRQIEAVAREIADAFGAWVTVTEGEALLAANYPAVHAVGRAAAPDRQPRMIELAWTGPGAAADAPHVVLVGKGVAFDTGGLDLKPSSGMRWMKKDMGGAAHALALARLVMGAGLPVRLTVLVAAVENAVSADAMRPGDVLATRAGLSVEVGNTDAEGRLILADALTRAGELAPDLTIDLATLTGAARVALGPEVVAFYTPDDALAAEIEAAGRDEADPVWRMPLWAGYDEALNSDVADLKNDGDPWAQAGSVVAALFLRRFAPERGAWAHFDLYAWNARSTPGRPQGGEAQAIRALFTVLERRWGGRT